LQQLPSEDDESDEDEEGVQEEENVFDVDEEGQDQEPTQGIGRNRVRSVREALSRGQNSQSNDEDGFPCDWPHPVEDRFMKLSEMERFLEDAEAKVWR
jgi:hypothetical protein